ncbi:putative hydrolase of the HAD superfamily [Salinibacillus kushneri]|uniref:Putative hydrolase of the HAD superfamily n=1 Tax=Salinibacillus kushneri TaxID=237682 RepID=A0A1I0GPR4_9BACI|nr:HAD hydrolase-like protein [Salinibacillus kushneri]SET73295.1 putative hydrolase of the HAD superfamily [Salinibacillus kushneri]
MLNAFIEKTDVIIFDLDGTLYEGDQHFALMVNHLKQRLPEKHHQSFDELYQQSLAGKHALTIGKVYDIQEDVIWTWNPFTTELTNAQNWNNELVHIKNAPDKLAVSEFDYKRFVPIGDGWWPPYSIARHFGLSNEDTQWAYRRTKEQMAKLDGMLEPTPGLQEYLEELSKTKKLVLITNSEMEDVHRLLRFLDLDHIFSDIVPSALKPTNTKKHFKDVLARYNEKPEQVLSIGDNFMNEVAPALQLGMYAVWLTTSKEEPVKEEKFMKIRTLATK